MKQSTSRFVEVHEFVHGEEDMKSVNPMLEEMNENGWELTNILPQMAAQPVGIVTHGLWFFFDREEQQE